MVGEQRSTLTSGGVELGRYMCIHQRNSSIQKQITCSEYFSSGCFGLGQGRTFQNTQLASMSNRYLILKPVVISLKTIQNR